MTEYVTTDSPVRTDKHGEHLTVTVQHPGETGMMTVRPPKREGWRCTFVGRYGGSRTVFSYRRPK